MWIIGGECKEFLNPGLAVSLAIKWNLPAAPGLRARTDSSMRESAPNFWAILGNAILASASSPGVPKARLDRVWDSGR